jgi:protein gp37
VSPGCKNCYAERDYARKNENPRVPSCHGYAAFRIIGGKPEPHWTGKVDLITEKLTEPLSWRAPRRVFVNSVSDLFHESLPDEAIDKVFAVMALCPQHTFQVLTKRSKRMREYLTAPDVRDRIARTASDKFGCIAAGGTEGRKLGSRIWKAAEDNPARNGEHWPLRMVHLGVSVESQKYADERIPDLLATPAAVRWVSAEPLLETLDIEWSLRERCRNCDAPLDSTGKRGREVPLDAALACGCKFCWHCADNRGRHEEHEPDEHCGSPKLDWVVIGGESGPNARPFDIAWARSIIAQCKAAGTACFFKQAGSNAYWDGAGPGPIGYSHKHHDEHVINSKVCWLLRLKDRKGGDPAEWPADLRVREYPA